MPNNYKGDGLTRGSPLLILGRLPRGPSENKVLQVKMIELCENVTKRIRNFTWANAGVRGPWGSLPAQICLLGAPLVASCVKLYYLYLAAGAAEDL